MRPHPRIRKTIKWGGLIFAGAMVAFIVLTSNHYWTRYWTTGTRVRSLDLWAGMLSYRDDRAPAETYVFGGLNGWNHGRTTTRRIRWWRSPWRPIGGTRVELPLWVPALASLTAAGFAWRLDTLATRRAKLGMCPKCSYSRAGLTPSSPCPECGSAAPSA